MKGKRQYLYSTANMFDIAESIYIALLADIKAKKIQKAEIRERATKLVENFARFI